MIALRKRVVAGVAVAALTIPVTVAAPQALAQSLLSKRAVATAPANTASASTALANTTPAATAPAATDEVLVDAVTGLSLDLFQKPTVDNSGTLATLWAENNDTIAQIISNEGVPQPVRTNLGWTLNRALEALNLGNTDDSLNSFGTRLNQLIALLAEFA